MDNLKKIFQLVAREQKPCFVASEDGQSLLVIIPFEEYQKLRPSEDRRYEELAVRVNELTRQTEELNHQIIQAQIEEFEEELDTEARGEDRETKDLEAVYIEPLETSQ